jgi:hypothetical protein
MKQGLHRCRVTNVGWDDGYGGTGCGEAVKGMLLLGGGDAMTTCQANLACTVGDELLSDL